MIGELTLSAPEDGAHILSVKSDSGKRRGLA